jgi:hypothetical protein
MTMARMKPLGIHEVDDEIRHLCEEAERQSGTSASSWTCARNLFFAKACREKVPYSCRCKSWERPTRLQV